MAKTTKTAVKRTPTKAAATAKKTTAKKKAVTLTNKEKKAALDAALAAKKHAGSAPLPPEELIGTAAPAPGNPPVEAHLHQPATLVDGHASGVATVLTPDAARELAERDAQAVQAADGTLRVPDGPDAVIVAPASPAAQGVSPDVTSPVDLSAPVLGSGVAKLHELAPGQSLAPSPPISSSNILPQPEKPSFG